ncbi:hypothetical protein [Acinetobacter seifertii]|uniref:hypothetical protein n=1 Tax=Acinetobacter seifertii TaxID=1530123 RepID=UPI003AF9FCE7
MMKNLNILLISILFVFSAQRVIAQERVNLAPSEMNTSIIEEKKNNLTSENAQLIEKIKTQESNFSELNKQYEQQKNELEKLVKDYTELKTSVEIQKKSDELIGFSSWASFLLTTVAVLVTILGVVIAIISLIGFRGIKAQAEAIASATAETQVKVKLHQIAVKEFQKLIDEGALNPQLNSAVDMIIRLKDVPQYDELDEYDEAESKGE